MARQSPKIPQVRAGLHYMRFFCEIDDRAKQIIDEIEPLTWRARPHKRVPSKRVKITPEMKALAKRLRDETSLTQFEIANKTGILNQGDQI